MPYRLSIFMAHSTQQGFVVYACIHSHYFLSLQALWRVGTDICQCALLFLIFKICKTRNVIRFQEKFCGDFSERVQFQRQESYGCRLQLLRSAVHGFNSTKILLMIPSHSLTAKRNVHACVQGTVGITPHTPVQIACLISDLRYISLSC